MGAVSPGAAVAANLAASAVGAARGLMPPPAVAVASARGRGSGGGLAMRFLVLAALMASPAAVLAQGIEGRWKLMAAEDLRADGTVARYPWGRSPVGSIVVEGGSCYVQIMSSDVPAFKGTTAVNEQMAAMLLSSYIAYSGPCTVNTAEGSVTLKVEAAWRPNYVGTEQKRFFKIKGTRMFFGPAPNSMKTADGPLTRRLTLERQ
jgi:hypothetical protein